MRFELDEEQRYEAAKALLIRRCAKWATARGGQPDPFVLSMALDSRHLSVDGRLSWWTPAQVRRFLLEWIPRQTAAEPDELLHAPETLRILIDYLDDTGLLDPRGGSATENAAAIDRAAAEFPEALRDPMRQSIGTFWARTALAHGVDLTDQAALMGFLSDTREGRVAYDEELLERLVAAQFSDDGDDQEPDGGRALAQPPVVLPPESELAEAAGRSAVVHRLRLLAEWAGKDGRALTAHGYLRMADARELVEKLGTGDTTEGVRSSGQLAGLNRLLEWAKVVRVVRVSKGRLYAVAKAAPLLADPLALWRRAFDAFFELGDEVCRSQWQDGGFSALQEEFEIALPDVLATVYGMEHPVPVPRLTESAWQGYGELSPLFNPFLDLVPGEDEDDEWALAEVSGRWRAAGRTHLADDLERSLRVLEELGAVEVIQGVADPLYSMDLVDRAGGSDESIGPGEFDELGLPDLFDDTDDLDQDRIRSPFSPEATAMLREELKRPVLLVRLTGLGTAAMRERFVAEGREAGVVGELVDAPPAGLLGVIADHYDHESARAEIGGWLAAHGDGIEPLLDAVRTSPFRARAQMMLNVLIESAPGIRDLLPELRDDPVLTPLVVTHQIAEGTLTHHQLTERQGTLGLAESLLGFLEATSPEQAREHLETLAPAGGLRAFADDVLSSGHPAAEAMDELREVFDEVLGAGAGRPLRLVGGRTRTSAPGSTGRPTGRGKKGKSGKGRKKR